MNIRSLHRGDGVVIGAAVLLLIASFLNQVSGIGSMAWDNLGLLMSVYLSGIIGAALIILCRMTPETRKVVGLDVRQFGVALTLFAAWTSLWTIIDFGVPSRGPGIVLGFLAALVLAGGAVATPLAPALQAPLVSAPRPPQVPATGGPSQGYGNPTGTANPFASQVGQPAQQQGQPFGTQGGFAAQGGAAPAAAFAPFWFAVPVARPLYGEDGSTSPIAELAPGTWYLAVEQRGAALVAQTQDGRRGVLQDATGIQRG